MIQRGQVFIVKTRGPRTEPCGRQKTEHRIKYHEQTLSGSVVPDRFKTIQVLYLTDQTCLLTYRKQ